MVESQYSGMLVIGDPHLEGRQPGFRKDDYPQVILQKLEWSLDYARSHSLLPIILGDLFDKPRDNPNWLVVRLFDILNAEGEVLGIYGNHDVHYQPELTEHDSLSLLVESGRIRIVSVDSPWSGVMNGRPVIVGGSSYRQEIPKSFDCSQIVDSVSGEATKNVSPFVVWLTHHDLIVSGYDEGRIQPAELEGIDLVINGHIHRRLETVSFPRTKWITPGNISRRSRSDAVRSHVPSVLRIDVKEQTCPQTYVEVPHAPFEEVFHEAILETNERVGASAFVAGLSELQMRRTSGGEGLKEFLQQNLDQFEPKVTEVIWKLAAEVTNETSSPGS